MSVAQQMHQDIQLRAAQRDANQILRAAEHDHGRNLALLVAALAELDRLDPENLIHVPHVQERICAIGGWTIDRHRSFLPIWDLQFNLKDIMKDVLIEHEAAKQAAIATLDSASPEAKRGFFRFWKKHARLLGFKFSTVDAAESARVKALQLARDAQLGDELDIGRLLRWVQSVAAVSVATVALQFSLGLGVAYAQTQAQGAAITCAVICHFSVKSLP